MTTAFNTAIAAHIEALTILLLGDKAIRPGLAFAGGLQTHPIKIGTMANESDHDLIHLAFDPQDPAPAPEITIALPRPPICHMQSGCRLFLAEGAKRAVILPQEGGRGHYRVQPREIVQVDRWPDDIAAGIERANRRLDQLMRAGASAGKRITIHHLPCAA